MAHPDLFLAISSGSGPEERMVRFLEYYLTAFHEGRKGAVAKKPYNPVLGETFHCSWEVPRDRVRPLRSQTHPDGSAGREMKTSRVNPGTDCYRVRFVAEQVSHHPPVSGFYCECAERGMCVNTHVWTKSKFMGMSVGVSMVGEGECRRLMCDVYCLFSLWHLTFHLQACCICGTTARSTCSRSQAHTPAPSWPCRGWSWGGRSPSAAFRRDTRPTSRSTPNPSTGAKFTGLWLSSAWFALISFYMCEMCVCV